MSKTFVWNMKGGRNVTPDRVEKDFYPTPAWATRLLMSREQFPDKIWEPACGDGAMAKILEETNEVVATDLLARGYGKTGVDFLNAPTPKGVQAVVTNPPFYLGRQFIERSAQTGEKAALLLQTSVLGGILTWADCLIKFRPQKVYFIRERLEYWKNDKWSPGVFAHAWLVWDHSRITKKTTVDWVSKHELP